jgi:arabinofuranan 3-O-arabinosyltransferase
MTSAGRGQPQPGQWQAFERGGSPLAGTIDLSSTIPMIRIARSAAGTRPPPRKILRDRWWFLIVLMVALTIFCGTDTGRIFFDTKLGVDINAGEFLSRLWSLWNPLEWFGSLQDQYIGYAIPMAPFFLVGQLLHVPVWFIERLWLSLLLAVGFTGMVRLARALNIGSENSRLLAGIVFALWPTFTILIGSTSAAALPGLVVPWAVLPLIAAARGRSTAGRAAARSGVVIAAMGGVNAVCTLAVLVLPAMYIITHTTSRQRVLLGLKWGAAVIAATAWWAIPLLLQGHYSFNFLPYIEQAATTTRTMSAAAVLRGTGTWTAYFNLTGTPWLAAGWAMVTAPAAILASAVVSAVGLAGLARRDMPERRWLCLCAGLVAVAALAGYYGPLGGPFHAAVGSLLNGTLSPFRSLYKLEPVLAVALALGCAHAMDRCWRLSVPLGRTRLAAAAATAPIVALTLAGLAWPQLTGQALQAGSFTSVPGYWYQTAAYLAARSPRETALVVPANPHGQYTWGDTIDDPLESLATSPWVERGLVPYGGAGSQDLLATAEQAIESGHQIPGLAAYLARAGIRYIVVRNDTATTISGYTPPQVANETLALSGFRRVAAFGPQVPAAPGYPNLVGLTPGFAPSYPAVEIFQSADGQPPPASPVAVLPVRSTALVNGGPDALLQLAAQGILASQPAVIAGQQLAGSPALWAVTDGQRRADNDFGSTNDYQSYTYTATETNPPEDPLGGAGGPPRQLLPVPAAGHQTVAVLRGAASVTASSAGTWIGEAPQYSPVNAFDGNPATAWAESDPYTPAGQWIQITFDHPVDLGSSVGIQLLDDSLHRPVADELRVTTAAGSAISYPVRTGTTQPLRVPPGLTRSLRITILGASNVVPGAAGAGISEVLIPGVRVTSYLQPAQDVTAGTRAPAVAYSFGQQVASPYSQDNADSVTAGQRLDRTFVTPAVRTLTAQLTAAPTAGPALNALLARLTPADRSAFVVTASSTWDSLPEFGPDSLYEPGSRLPWISGAGDPNPQLEFSWHGRRTIRQIVLQGAYGVTSAPTGVLLGGRNAFRLEKVGLGGIVRVSPPLRTNRLYLSFSALSSSAAGNTAAGQPSQLPVGLAKITIPALAGLHAAVPQASAPFRLSCGQGPAVSVGGQTYQTSVTGTVGDLIQLRPVQLHLCTPGGALTLAAGRQWLSTGASADFTITSLSLTSQPAVAADPSAPARNLDILTWGADNRTVRIGPGAASFVEIHQDADAGWTATLDGRPLQPATLDGWQQAFIVPAGHGGTIKMAFQPATIYHAGLIASGLLLLILLAFSMGTGWWRGRPPGPADTYEHRHSQPGPGEFRLGQPSRPVLIFRTAADAGPAGATAASGRRLAGRHGRHSQTRRATDGPVPGKKVPAPGLQLTRAGLARSAAILLPIAIVIAVAGGSVVIAVPVLAVIGGWRPRWLPGIAAGAMLAAGLLIATSRVDTALGSGPFSGAAQACALIALAAALLPDLTRPDKKEVPDGTGRGAAQDPGLPGRQGQPALL